MEDLNARFKEQNASTPRVISLTLMALQTPSVKRCRPVTRGGVHGFAPLLRRLQRSEFWYSISKLRWFLSFALLIPTVHDFCVISARTWALARTAKRKAAFTRQAYVGKLVLADFKMFANSYFHASNSTTLICNVADIVQWHSRRVAACVLVLF